MNNLTIFIKNNFYRSNGHLKRESVLRKNFPNEYSRLIEFTSFLNEDVCISERIYCFLNNIKETVKCQTCKINNVNFNVAKNNYYNFCSTKCMANNEGIKNSRVKTNIEKYGHVCNLHSDICREKMKETCLKKYGVEHYSKSQEIKDKKRKTFVEKYGVETPGQIEEGKEKSKRTCFEKYGVEYTGQIKERSEKMKKTMQERYGVSYFLEKTDIPRANFIRNKSYDEMLKNKFDKPMFSREEYIKRGCSNGKLLFKCNKCGNIFEVYHSNGFHDMCPKCFPVFQTSSKPETEFKHFLKEILEKNNFKYEENNREILKPRELDFFIPQLGLAFEFDGLYWHSDKFKDKNYHLNKTQDCLSQKINLTHIFEDDWYYKRKIVESRVKNFLGDYDKIIYARKCFIKVVSFDKTYEFLENNHIQGYCSSKINLGLYFENELVSIMTFGKPRFNKKYEYELLRFCNKLNHHVIGGASKLLRYFEKNYKPKSLISYADRRWSKGNLYYKLGFELIGNTKPNYWYYSKRHCHPKLENRMLYQKHKLKSIIQCFDSSKSEMENMKNNNYGVIYDCGSLIFEKMYNI